MRFYGDPQYINRLHQPRIYSNRCFDRVIGSLEAEHSRVLGASLRTNQEGYVLTLVGGGGGEDPTNCPRPENCVFHEAALRSGLPNERSTVFGITISVQIRRPVRQARRMK